MECNGRSSTPCGCGHKKKREFERIAIIDGILFDCDLISRFIEPVQAQEFWFTKPTELKYWMIGGEDWRVYLMPLRTAALPKASQTIEIDLQGAAVAC